MNATNFRVQVVDITVPNATAAGTVISFEDKLRSDFERCIGYAIQETSNPNTQGVSVQIILQDGEVLQDYVHYYHLQPGSGAPMSDRYHKADFRSKDQKIFIKARPIVNLTADVTLQLVFLLKK